MYSTVPQPTSLYIDPHRSALACFASGVSEGRFSKWWVDVDIAQHIHFIIKLENERKLDIYNYSFILWDFLNQMSSLWIMLLVKANLAYLAIPFS